MGLFFNMDEHPDVFKNKNEKIPASNQVVVRHHFLTDLMMEQQKANADLTKLIAELKNRFERQEETQNLHWNEVNNQMHGLKVSSRSHEETENRMIQKINTLDEKSSKLQEILETESLSKKSILDQMKTLSTSNKEMASRLEKNEGANEQLSLKINEQLELQKKATRELEKQEEFQAEVLTRMDQQEAMSNKIILQLNHIRSILFERTNYLAQKLADGYKLTSSHVYKLMTGSEQPLTFSMLNYKKDEKQKQSN